MAITLNGTTGITTPDIDTDGLSVDTNAIFVDPATNNVGIGTSSPLAKLSIGAGSIADVNTPIQMNAAASSGEAYIGINNAGGYGLLVGYDNLRGYASIRNIANTPIAFSTNDIERMRIDSAGRVAIGTTTGTGLVNANAVGIRVGPDAVAGAIFISHLNLTASGNGYLAFGYNGTQIGSVSQNGTTAVSYNTSSDYRLKENVTPMQNALATVTQLKPVTYNWKTDGSSGQGFIAHELQAVVPDCVTGEKDAVDEDGKPQYQGVDTSFLVATLVAAIQEQQTLIQSLTARIEALEAV